MRYGELLIERRQEFTDAVIAGQSRREIAGQFGVCVDTVSRAARRLNLKLPDMRGRPRGDGSPERTAEIIALREQDQPLSMRAIGNLFGISHEYVRQILNKAGRNDLCGAITNRIYAAQHETLLVDWTCVNCGKAERRMPGRAKAKTCSSKCFGEHKRPPLKETQLIFGPRILELREAGKTWLEIADHLGIEGKSYGSRTGQVGGILSRWAERVGASISHVKGTKHNPVRVAAR